MASRINQLCKPRPLFEKFDTVNCAIHHVHMDSWEFRVRCKECMSVLVTLTMAEGMLTASFVEIALENYPDSIPGEKLTLPVRSTDPISTQIELKTDNFAPMNYAVRCECVDSNQKKIHNVSSASLAQLGQVKGRRDFLV